MVGGVGFGTAAPCGNGHQRDERAVGRIVDHEGFRGVFLRQVAYYPARSRNRNNGRVYRTPLGGRPYWFLWVVSGAVYGFLPRKYGLRGKLCRWLLRKVAKRHAAGDGDPGSLSGGGRPNTASSSEPSSGAEDGRCQGSLVYMRVQNTDRPLATSPCSVIGDDHVLLATEDAALSQLPEGDRVDGIPMCLAHQTAYHTLRGRAICRLKDCYHLGTLVADGGYYSPAHLPDDVTHKAPVSRVSFEDKDRPQTDKGLAFFPDVVINALIRNVGPAGEMDDRELVEELTNT